MDRFVQVVDGFLILRQATIGRTSILIRRRTARIERNGLVQILNCSFVVTEALSSTPPRSL